VRKFFPNVDPIGKEIRVQTHTYEVIGVAEPLGSAFGESQDNYMVMPIFRLAEKAGHTNNDWVAIFVQAPNAEMMQASQDEARMLFRAWRHLPYDAPDNFAILGSDSIMQLWHDLTGNLAFVASGAGECFSGRSAEIVIMNIMAGQCDGSGRARSGCGARWGPGKKHIMLQFLTESAVLAGYRRLDRNSDGLLVGVLSKGAVFVPHGDSVDRG